MATLAVAFAACGDQKPYEFEVPSGFKDIDPKEFGQPIAGANSDPEKTRLLTSDRLGEGLDFIRVYTTEDPERLPPASEVVGMFRPALGQLRTKILGETPTTLGGMQAVRLELQPANVLGRPIQTWLTIATRDKTAYFVQCQWERAEGHEQVVTTACNRVLQTFEPG